MGYSKSSSIWEVYSNKCPYEEKKKDLRQPNFTSQRTRGKKKKKQTKPTDEAVAIGAWLGWRGGKAPVDNVRRMRSIGGWVVTKGSGLTISHDVEE